MAVLAVVLIVEGMPYFAFPKKAREWALSVHEIPTRTLRALGLGAMVTGLFLLFIVKFFI